MLNTQLVKRLQKIKEVRPSLFMWSQVELLHDTVNPARVLQQAHVAVLGNLAAFELPGTLR